MSQNVRPLVGYLNLTDPQLLALAGAVVKGMTGNLAFSNPSVDLKVLQSAIDAFSAAIAAQAQGGTAATADKKNKRNALIVLLRKLAHYVHDNCGNDLAILLSSGFPAANTSRARISLTKPSILSIAFGKSTELVLKVRRIAQAKCYNVHFALLGPGNTPGAWQDAGVFTAPRSINVGGLTPMATYMFQVRAARGSNEYSDWSDAVTHVCI